MSTPTELAETDASATDGRPRDATAVRQRPVVAFVGDDNMRGFMLHTLARGLGLAYARVEPGQAVDRDVFAGPAIIVLDMDLPVHLVERHRRRDRGSQTILARMEPLRGSDDWEPVAWDGYALPVPAALRDLEWLLHRLPAADDHDDEVVP